MRGQRTVRERSEYSLTVLSTGSARENFIELIIRMYSPFETDVHRSLIYVWFVTENLF